MSSPGRSLTHCHVAVQVLGALEVQQEQRDARQLEGGYRQRGVGRAGGQQAQPRQEAAQHIGKDAYKEDDLRV